MKKLYFLATALFAGFSLNAQVLVANNAATFGTWSVVDADGDTFNWGGATVGAFPAQGEMVISRSWDPAPAPNGTALTPDNFLISPAVDLSTATTVTFNWKAGSPEPTGSGFEAENYSVYVVTDLTTFLVSPPAPVFTETLSVGEAFQSESYNATAIAAGQATVYFVFRHHGCTDMNFLMIDDVEVIGTFASVEENEVVSSVYPNPTSGLMNFTFSNNETSHIVVRDLAGRTVSTVDVNSALTVEADFSELANGTYIYETVSFDGAVTSKSKFVKQ